MVYRDKSEDRKELIRLRRWFHQHPELSMQEYETSRFISEYLSGAGIPNRILGKTGVIGDLQVDDKLPTLAVRAEIDALPIEEQTGLAWTSCHPGKMHACGHDAIAAVVLFLAGILSREKQRLNCNVRFLFEPAEETGEGARYMMANGALEDPKPDGILVFHFGNQESRSMEIQRSISTAQICGLSIEVKGKASHWSQRSEGIDAMYAAARIVIELQKMNETCVTQRPFVLGFGLLQAGQGGNILAEKAELTGSLRTFTDEDFEKLYLELNRRLQKIQQETGARITLQIIKKIPSIVNDPVLVKQGACIGRKLFGERFFLGEHPFLAGDNGAFYMEQVPGLRAVFLAGKEGETAYPVHNPRFDIEEGVLLDALEFLEEFVLSFPEKRLEP